MKYIKLNEYIINPALLGSILTILFYHIIGHVLISKGFTLMQFSLFVLTYGLGYLIFLSLFILYFVTIYVNKTTKKGDGLKKWWVVSLYIVMYTFIFSLIIDGVYSYLIDNTILNAFADKLMEMNLSQGKSVDEITNKSFHQLSSFLQNLGINIFCILFSAFISVPIAYKIGKARFIEPNY